MERVDIKDISGSIRFSTIVNEGSKRKFLLMKEDYVTVKFNLDEPIFFKLGDYIDDGYLGVFEICDIQKPAYDAITASYDYELRLDAYYWKWKKQNPVLCMCNQELLNFSGLYQLEHPVERSGSRTLPVRLSLGCI